MATKKKEERVEVLVPKKHLGEEADLFVGLNGVNYVIPKGKKTMVPKAVADEIKRALAAETAAEESAAEMAASAGK